MFLLLSTADPGIHQQKCPVELDSQRSGVELSQSWFCSRPAEVRTCKNTMIYDLLSMFCWLAYEEKLLYLLQLVSGGGDRYTEP